MVNSKSILFSKQAGLIVSLFCIFYIYGCSPEEKTIATVGDSVLTENEAYLLLKNKGFTINDTIELKNIVKEWCDQESYIQHVKNKYPEEWEIIELRSHEFSSDLAHFFTEEKELRKLLDTVVSSKEINDYYDSHQEEFVLQDYLVKALYLKIPQELDFRADNVNSNYLLKNDKDLTEINSYAKLYAENFYFNDSSWIYFNEIVKDVPITKYNVDNIVLNRSKTYFSDDNFTYFINIIDFKLKSEAPPVSFLENEIKRIIVSQRLQELKEKNESTLIQRINKENEISIKF